MGYKITGKVIFTGSVQSGGEKDFNWTIQNASFSGNSFDVSSEDGLPSGVIFNNDGTRMFVVGFGTDAVYQYNLSTGFDITTAGFSGNSFDLSSQENVPTGIVFNHTGTRMFVVGNDSNSVFQYNLTTGFDISTATFSGNSLNVISEDGAPQGVHFNDDGTRMFMLGTTSDSVHVYNLTTGFDISTASFSGVSFDVSSEDSNPTGVAFSTTGTRMFVVGNTSNSVHQYNLTTGFDITTATYSGHSFNVNTEDTGRRGITFNPLGTLMFMVGLGNDKIYQYDL